MKKTNGWFKSAIALMAAVAGLTVRAAEVTIGATAYDSLNAALAAVKNGETIKVVGDDTPASVQAVANVNGKTFTIKGAGAANSTIVVGDGNTYGSDGCCDYRLTGANVTFEDIKIKHFADSANHQGFAYGGVFNFKNCSFRGVAAYWGSAPTFDRCTFDHSDIYEYCLWTWSTPVMTIRNCTFLTQGKAVKMYAENVANVLNIENCTFVSNGQYAKADKPAVAINSSISSGMTLSIENSTQTGFVAGATGSALYGSDKADEVASNIFVTVDDGAVWSNGKVLPKATVEKQGDENCDTTVFDIYRVSVDQNVDLIVEGGKIGEHTADILYKFTADPNDTDNAYKNWYADFVVSFDKNVEKGSLGLVGKYSGWNVGFTPSIDVPAGFKVPLLNQLTKNSNWDYEKIRTIVREFLCGVYNLENNNWGTTMTVELRLFDPDQFKASADIRDTAKWDEGVNTFCVSKILYRLGPVAKVTAYDGTATLYRSFAAAAAAAKAMRTGYATIELVADAVVTNTTDNPLDMDRSSVAIKLESHSLTVENSGAFKISGNNVWLGGGSLACNGCALEVTGSDVMAEGITSTGSICVSGPVGNIAVEKCTITADGALTARDAGVILALSGTYSGGTDGTAIAIPAGSTAHVIVKGGVYDGKLDAASGLIDIRAGKFANWTGGAKNKLLVTGGTFDADPSAYVDSHYQANENSPSNGWWTVTCKYAAKMIGEDGGVIGWYDDLQTPVDMIRAGTVGVIVLTKPVKELKIPEDVEVVVDEDGDTTLVVYTYLVSSTDETGAETKQYFRDFEEVCKEIESQAKQYPTRATPRITIVNPSAVKESPSVDYKIHDNGTSYELKHKVYTCQVVDKTGQTRNYETYDEAMKDVANSGTGKITPIVQGGGQAQTSTSSDYQKAAEQILEDLNVTEDDWEDGDDGEQVAVTKEGYTIHRVKNYDNSYSYTLEVYVAQIGDVSYTSFEDAIADKTNKPEYADVPIVVKNYNTSMVAPQDWKFVQVQTGDANVFHLVAKVYICSIVGKDGKKYETFEEAIKAMSSEETMGELQVINYNESTMFAPSGWRFSKRSSGSWILAAYATTGKGDIDVALKASGWGVSREAITQVISDIFIAQQIETVTEVLGVKLTTISVTNDQGGVELESGVRRVVAAAETAAGGDSEFAQQLANATNVTIKVDVAVAPTAYVPASSGVKSGKMSFSLTPTATVTAVGESSSASVGGVLVSNDMIDQDQQISVSLYTGFKPVQIVHRDNDNKLIKEYTGSEIAYSNGVATVKVNHFSTLTATEAAVSLWAARIGSKYYNTLSNAVDAVKSGETIYILSDNAETFSVAKACSFSMNNAGGYQLTGNITASGNYKFVVYGDGTCKYQTKYVAQIGDTQYASLAAAVDAIAGEGTITMIADEDILGNEGVTIPADKTVTLDLNGKTVTGVANKAANSQVILNCGTLVICDSSSGKSGKIVNKGVSDAEVGPWYNSAGNIYTNNVIVNRSRLTIQSGTVNNTLNGGVCFAVDNDSSSSDVAFVLQGGTVSSSYQTAMRVFCNSTASTNGFTMSEGTLSAQTCGFRVQLAADYKGDGKAAAVAISGGTVRATRSGTVYAWYDGSTVDNGIWDKVDYAITAGTFRGRITSGMKGFITGGEYSEEPAAKYLGDKLVAEWWPLAGCYKIVNKYLITYVLDGGVNADANPTNFTENTADITLTVPTKDKYAFLGWYKDAEYSKKLADGVIAKGSAGDLTLYARWEDGLPVDVGTTGESQSEILMLPKSYVTNNVDSITNIVSVDEVKAAIEASTNATITANKLTLVENYVLGLDPKVETSVPVVVPVQKPVTKSKATGLSLNVGNITINKDIDATVTYVLETSVTSASEGYTTAKQQVDNRVFDNIELPTTGVKYYRIKVKVSK